MVWGRSALCALLALGAGISQAHHSGSMWDSSKAVTVEGTVKQFQWNNPHCWIQLLVPVTGTPDGAPQEWSIEMAAPIQVLQGGWKPGTVKPGDRIQVSVHPARDGTHAGNFISAQGADGKPLGKSQQDHQP
jgi:hypothetical protein